ncbi:protein obstructor-E-like isoform X1 [Anopheles arabiensis]|uniref:Chitin-binding type-2 domain-containing protein n=1 Tax=Anopheles arabiensis TaxID=7173 RepID=A0A182I5S6_ANOAR|nr:protein obstructor-E-like isoform X1 [Anopheles arabiensis]
MQGGSVSTVWIALLALGVSAITAEPTCRPTGQYLTANPRDCRSYFYCYDGIAYYGVCQQGFRFDESRQSCLPSTVAECFECPTMGMVSLPHPTSCQKFVLCFEGVANERSCPTGLLFNRQIHQCDLSSKVIC